MFVTARPSRDPDRATAQHHAPYHATVQNVKPSEGTPDAMLPVRRCAAGVAGERARSVRRHAG